VLLGQAPRSCARWACRWPAGTRGGGEFRAAAPPAAACRPQVLAGW